MQALIDAGADLEATNRYGMTALHVAADVGWRDVCCLLVRMGAKHDAKNGPLRDNDTPVQVATQFGWTDVCEAMHANERRPVRLAGGLTVRYSATFPTWEPPPFSAKRMNPQGAWGRESKHGAWGVPPNPLTPKFVPRETKLS